ncbi:isochorismatase family protein [Allostreptomyces psammosilenae]|uniref:Bifunctional isochorismate lyase/aryl carrier protein n=1 Tax=Allostreptomyces psammosilenae TaxID=1892865 RepID=A0A853A5X2_9ACTN|nr:isochorismatase family protein [Allostreptomyces psammosilenae]NYI08244.1 bifunctional isochorismate lyase/aryl carrier protein [Allostreptomyces psammosilenae]
MALPSIAPYALPTEDELPPARVPWTIDPGRAALLVHDMERHFVDAFPQGAEPIRTAVAHIATLTAAARAAGTPVIYCAQPSGQTPAQRGLQLEWWGPGVGDDPARAAVIDELTPLPGDVTLTKWRYSAFQRTRLAELLAERGRDQLVVTGIYAHIGCLMTAADAFQRDIQAFLVADAVADFSPEEHRQALRWAAGRCAVVLSTRRAAAQLGDPGRRPDAAETAPPSLAGAPTGS